MSSPIEHLAALAVDDLALLVHHVVVLQHVLADVVVAALDALLGVFDLLGEHAVLDGHVLVHACSFSIMGRDAVGAEQAHQVVLQRDEELAGAGVALTAGAAAQLVVDAAGLVPLGADDVQAAQLR